MTESDLPEVSPETLAALSSVTTATVSMQLLKRGIRRCWLKGPTSLHPPGHPTNRRLVGEAFTIRFLPLREDLGTPESYNQEGSLRDAIEALPAGHIVVVDSRESADCATLGDIMVARVQARGGLGVVCDGPLRDISAVKALSFPVYCTGASAPPSIAGLVFAGWQEPIGCGGVAIMPGDIMLADEDGVVVVPRGLAAEVAAAGVEQERFERYVQKRIEEGAPVKGLYPPDDETLRAYEAWCDGQTD